MIGPLSYFNLCVCLSAFKLLFLKSYVSTDFDVHRNWMAITYSASIKDWYFESTSEWTLDYPPLFAAFEFLLALIAHYLKLHDGLVLSATPIRIESIIIYQKLTVILSDTIYYYATYKLCQSLEPIVRMPKTTSKEDSQQKAVPQKESNQCLLDAIYRPDTTSCIALLLLFQPGLLLVDHIHFQYNGLLSGIFLLSVSNIIAGKYASGSFWFALLLNFKHIYLYYAPAFGMYLLSSYCLAKVGNQNRVKSFLTRTTKLGLVVVLVLCIIYLPFADVKVLNQIVSRLFPFKRGLTHAYWAPNIWSIYNTIDKLLATFTTRPVKFDMDSISGAKPVSSTSGLVQQYEHQYLPTINPIATFSLVATFTVPLVIKLLMNVNRHRPILFMKAVTLAAFTSFMFGWHVHEKAIILVLLPMIPISLLDPNTKSLFLRITLAGTFSLFPLLYKPAEYPIKLTLLIAYYFYVRSLKLTPDVKRQNNERQSTLALLKLKTYNLLDNLFILGVVAIEVYVTILNGRFDYSWNPISKLNKYQFLPLLLISSFSALGNTFSYLELYYDFVGCLDEAVAA